ncbi:MAG: PDZ domain-containing protein, partial [Acidobacteria bacterium]|nr:PDZ domain-containing protein [Acidobacteriota bacterium]
EGADVELQHLLAIDPGFQLPESVAPPELGQRFSSLRRATVGRLALTVEPADAVVRIDGRPTDGAAREIPLLAGTRTVTARRPGYADVELQLEIRPGRSTPLDLRMERDSAMLRLVSRPAGARVLIDGQPAGETAGQAPEGYPLPASAARYPRAEFSAPLRVGGLVPGSHRLEVELEGFRPYRAVVEVPELRDYDAGAIVLDREEGTVVLRHLPRGAMITANGKEVRATPLGADAGRLRLPPGVFHLMVTDPAAGVFETRVSLADRQETEIQVALRPGLTLLGVVGGDRVAAGQLRTALIEAGEGLEHWAFIDRSERSEDLLARPEVSAQALRAAAEPAGGPPPVNWSGVQQLLGRNAPGSVYLLAVLSDDLLASYVDLWFLPAAPGPAQPDRRRLPTHKPDLVKQAIADFDRPLELQRPWLGALLVDSPAAQGPVVAALVPRGPAATSGLQPADEVVSALGQATKTTAELETLIAAQTPGSSLSVTVRRQGALKTLDLELGTSPQVVPLDSPDLIYAAISAYLTALAADPFDGTPPWLIGLNQAAVYLHGRAFDEAVRVLRGIEAPPGDGLGQGAVDYWLALALRALGPDYADQARQALERAAAQPGARLFHNDGPLVAPRARGRLAAQTSGG